MRREDIRNIAVVAHVDHGKTTLVDGFLEEANFFGHKSEHEEAFMDSNPLERERGITILAKCTSV
ncbi:MAG: translational GTPase TypA, partial [Planctomycetes bacterium]|nr:translational GTPase TypA [Planctomycetota bacterium]